jgi:DHA1 family bicyclomycin/chloramphenicol resistance-like MFS transporter
VVGFAVALGSVIALTAYLAVPESSSPSPDNRATGNVFRNYLALFRHARFTAFVLQTGFISGTFLAAATAASGLLKDMLHRPATEFGLYFLLFPFGYLAGNIVASRVGNRRSNETMVLAGSLVVLAAVAAQSSVLLRGISLSYAQAGAIATEPQLAGTAAGIGVFVHNFCGAAFAQLYGLLADGTARPLAQTTAISVLLALAAGLVPILMARRARSV